MKTYPILSCISFAALCTMSQASALPADEEVVVLPSYVVTIPHLQPAEQSVNASLAEFRQQARGQFLPVPRFSLPKSDVSGSLHVAGVSSAPAKILERKS